MVKKPVSNAKGAQKKKKAGRAAASKPKGAKPISSAASNDQSEINIAKNTTWMTAEQLAHFRILLLDKLSEITGDVDNIERGALKSSRADATGDLSSMPIHMADIGSDNYEQEFALGLMDGERQMVHEIIAALKRIENGTYGVCEGTGQPIPLTRLKGIPWARYCIEYAAKNERGRAARPSRSERNDEQQEPEPDQEITGETSADERPQESQDE